MQPAARHLLAALHEPQGRDHALLARLGDAEWAEVADLAIRQRVGALLLSQSRTGLVLPSEASRKLEERTRAGALRSLRLQAALRQLATAVAPQGIDLIVLKGLHLACAVYPHAHLREMADIDILVDERHLPTVSASASTLGYRPVEAGLATHHLAPIVRDGVSLELHYSIDSRAHGSPIVASDVAELETAVFAPNVKFLITEDLFVHLCMHAADSHVFESGVRSLCDIQALIAARGPAIRWERVAARAAQWNCERSVAAIIAMCRRDLGVHVAAEATRLFPAPPIGITDAALCHMFDTEKVTSEAAAKFATAGGVLAKARIAFDRITQPTQESRISRIAGLYKRHAGWLFRAELATDEKQRRSLQRREDLTQWLRKA
jgi:hypothetical protein